MDQIWAPWRLKYITKIAKKKSGGCVFCRILKEKKDKQNLVLCRTKYCYAVMNLYPYNNGHILILPNRHVNDLSKLKKDEREDLMDLLQTIKSILNKTIRPQGYNIGINLGKVAGAGFPGHLHIHIVPRWKGDVNFMPVTAQTKVISQSLKLLHQKLFDAYKRRH